MTALAYAGLVAFALSFLWFAKHILKRPVDHDPGPRPGARYPLWDRWSKWHLLGSAVLAFASCVLGVPPTWALTITLLGGVGWEFIHGHVDRADLLWDLAGAVAGVALCVAL